MEQASRWRRWAWTVLAAAALALALTGWLDAPGERYGEQAFKRALVTFALARTLNGLISVAQGTELAVEPAGVGVIFTVGEVLDPINDLVERFSTVMLVATSSLGLQNLLLDITAWWGFSALLGAAVAFVLVACWWPGERIRALQGLAVRALLMACFLRFVVPVLVIGTSLVFDTFLAAEQAAAEQALETTGEAVEAFNESAAPPEGEQSVFDQLGALLDESIDSLNVSARLERLRDQVSSASEHIVNLIVIFVLQTVILPLVFVWLLAQFLRFLAARATGL
jgi:hypothetical protein